MPATTYLKNKIVDHQLGKAAFTMPTVYVGLSSTTPNLGGTGFTEPSTGSYARVATSGATWTSAASGASSNAAAVQFPTATGDWVAGANLTYGLLFDASTGGNLLGYSALTVNKAILNGDTASLPIGAITVTLT